SPQIRTDKFRAGRAVHDPAAPGIATPLGWVTDCRCQVFDTLSILPYRKGEFARAKVPARSNAPPAKIFANPLARATRAGKRRCPLRSLGPLATDNKGGHGFRHNRVVWDTTGICLFRAGRN